MRRYKIQNVSNSMVRFSGFALASRYRGRAGGIIWVTDEHMADPELSGHIANGSLKILLAIPPLEEPKEPVKVIEKQEPEVQSEPVVEEEPVAEEVVEEASAEPAYLYSEEELSSKKYSSLRSLAKKHGIGTSGLKKADIISLLLKVKAEE